jgi:hypothetical protein
MIGLWIFTLRSGEGRKNCQESAIAHNGAQSGERTVIVDRVWVPRAGRVRVFPDAE